MSAPSGHGTSEIDLSWPRLFGNPVAPRMIGMAARQTSNAAASRGAWCA